MVYVYLIAQIQNLVSSNPSIAYAVLTYNAIVCFSFRVADTMFFSLVMLLTYTKIVEASRQVHKFANAEHRSYKDRQEAESAYMEFLQRNGRNVQYSASPS